MKRKNLTAALVAFAMAASCISTSTGLISTANDGGVEFALGDTSGDGIVDAKDASEILAEYTRLSTNSQGFFSGSRAKAADVNQNGKIDSSDASSVLMFYSYSSTGGDLNLVSFLDSLKPAGTGTTTTGTATTTTSTSTETTVTDTVTTTTVLSTDVPVTTTETADPNKVTEILVSRSSFTLKIGEGALSARVTMLPETATDLHETWSSSDENIAVVDDEGWVTAISPGKAIITVQSVNNPEAKAEIEVNVEAETTTSVDMKKVTSIRLDRTEVTMEVGTAELSANVTMLPAQATDLREIWTSSDENIVAVDGEGWITAKSIGKAIITVQSANNPEVTATIEVTVTDGTSTVPETTSTITSATTTTVSSSTETTVADSTDTDTDTVTSTTVTTTVSTSASSESTTASESNSDSTTAQTTTSAGTTETTTSVSTTADPKRVASIQLSVTSIELSVGERGISYVKMLPETAKNKEEIWTSSDPKVATVDIYGNISAVGTGECIITVRSADNKDVSADVEVKVYPKDKVRKIELTATELTIELGDKKISYVRIYPNTAVNMNELWVCSDTNIATVDEYGWITGKSIGECIVTVYSVDNPDVKADIKVTVVSPDVPETPTDTPPESKIIQDSTDEERIAFCTPFPDSAKGKFSIEYVITYSDETQSSNKTSVLTVPTLKDYTVYFKTDKGDFSVTSYLYNEDNGKRARIGTYEFKASPAECTTTVEDIIYAFYYVGGLSE